MAYSKERIKEIISEREYITIATADDGGQPWNMSGKIYLIFNNFTPVKGLESRNLHLMRHLFQSFSWYPFCNAQEYHLHVSR